MVRGDEENVVVLLARLVDLTNSLVGGGNTLDGGLVHSSVANHIGRSEVVHDEVKVVLAETLRHLGANSGSAHLGVKIVGSNSGRGDHVTGLAGEVLLDTAVEEESDVSILLGLSNVALLEVLLAEPLGQDVTHVLRGEGNIEGVIGLVLSHGGEGDVLGVGEVRAGRTVVVTQELGDFTDTVRAVVEEEESIVIYRRESVLVGLHHGCIKLTLDTALLAANNDGLQELVVLLLLVALLDGLERV